MVEPDLQFKLSPNYILFCKKKEFKGKKTLLHNCKRNCFFYSVIILSWSILWLFTGKSEFTFNGLEPNNETASQGFGRDKE